MFIKKSFSLVVGVVTALLLMQSAIVSSASQRSSVLLGDANFDGQITMADYTTVNQYLSGTCVVSNYCLTAMDINNDKVIDKTDAYIIMYYYAYGIHPPTVTKDLYVTPDNSARWYKKYNCSTGNESTYYLGATSLNTDNEVVVDRDFLPISPDYYDNENTNVVQLVMSDGSCGSGFVLSNHIIATAAHCVLDSDLDFVSGVTVKIYNANEEAIPANCVATFTAQSYHVPCLFISTDSSHRYNYDYALIYVGDDVYGNDLLDYVNPWDFGVATQEFSQAQTGLITTSGYTSYGSGYKRYYSVGSVVDFSPYPEEAHNNPALRIASYAASNPGKSGGTIYYSSSFNNYNKSSVVGITTARGMVFGTWGTRVTPTLIRFYKQNPYI